jgi:methylated-DNA-[protein]-cysteine S-methyltransferase
MEGGIMTGDNNAHAPYRIGTMEIVIHTGVEGILALHLPFVEENTFGDDAIDRVVSGLEITVSGPHPSGVILARALRRYFHGAQEDLGGYPLVWGNRTGFERRVLDLAGRIPYGETMSYGELARYAGTPGAARAVGQVLKKNPWPIVVPCHRVIGSHGKLTGFSSGMGWKRMLLSLEKRKREGEG